MGRMVMTGGARELAAGMREAVGVQLANRAGCAERWGLRELL
jgi:hypothetical protein